jgi:tRNA (guanine-N7-)-methyltransferase
MRGYSAPEPDGGSEGEAPRLRAGRHVHGRRKGRKLTARQRALLDGLLPRLRISSRDCEQAEGALQSLFPALVEEIWLEIGFGGGEHLVAQALAHPAVGFIGAEPFVNGTAMALAAIDVHGLQDRIRLHDDDVLPLLDDLPPASLGRIFMLFPDPWPKLRHRQRRLLSANSLDRVVTLLKPGGQFRFASDSDHYARAARALCEAHSGLRLSHAFTSANRDAVPDWPKTRFEAKAELAGRSSTFLIFERL